MISLLVFSTPGIQPWLLSAVYGPNSYSDKRLFWDSVGHEVEKFPGAWLMIGDFNGVQSSRDRSNNNRIDAGSRFMKDTLDHIGMLSIPSSGFFYTWSNHRFGSGRSYSRIDRGMANDKWWELFPNASLKILPQSTSDHNPLVLYCFGQQGFSWRPFRFEAAWVEDQRCG
ncbi:hypothetical protein UlMin_030227 [Ulmus minor]